MDIERVHQLLATAGGPQIGQEIHYLRSLPSTMDVARDLAAQGGRHGLAVLAEEQTAGRGRLGRAWVAPPDVNIYLSLLLRPDPLRMRQLGMIAPLSVADAARTVAGVEVDFKWPNDVLVSTRKLCGVLIEAAYAGERPLHAIVGIGLNVNLDVGRVPEVREIATSLSREAGRRVSREHVLAELLAAFSRWFNLSGSHAEAVRLAWRGRLQTLGQTVDVTFGGRIEHGLAEDVDGSGSLIIRRDDGSRVALPAGEVTLRRE